MSQDMLLNTEWHASQYIQRTPGTKNELVIDPGLFETNIADEQDAETIERWIQVLNDDFAFTGPGMRHDNVVRSTVLASPEELEPLISTNKHAGVQAVERHQDTSPAYFANRGNFSEEEKVMIQQYCDEKPSSVMERLKEYNPFITNTYRQVKGAVENERRKKNRREANGPWTQTELQLMANNLHLPPKELVSLLARNVYGFAKNVDQVRDMKSQIVQRQKGRTRHW